MIRSLYYYFNNPTEREFYYLYSKYKKVKRDKRINNIKFLKYIIDVPDVPSFIWQFKEIFANEIYKFETNTKNPVIFD